MKRLLIIASVLICFWVRIANAAIALVGTPTTQNVGGASQTINYPAGHANGQVAYYYIQTQSTVTSISGTKTWVTLGNTAAVSGNKAFLLRRVLDGTEGVSETFTPVGGLMNIGGMRLYSGVNVSTPEDAAGGSSPQFANDAIQGTTATASGFTTTIANDELLFFMVNDGQNCVSASIPTGFGNASSFFDAGNSQSYASWDEAFVGPGVTGSVSTTLGSSSHWLLALVALQPTAPPATTVPPGDYALAERGMFFDDFDLIPTAPSTWLSTNVKVSNAEVR